MTPWKMRENHLEMKRTITCLNATVSSPNPLIFHCHVSHMKKRPPRILSIESWLFNRDHYMFFVHNPDIAVVFHRLRNPKQPRGPFFIAHVSYPVILRILGVRSSSSFNRKIHENPWQPYIAPPISQGFLSILP